MAQRALYRAEHEYRGCSPRLGGLTISSGAGGPIPTTFPTYIAAVEVFFPAGAYEQSFIQRPEIIPSMEYRDREGGVSEVVSTILMVAMAVILAGIVASLVLGMTMPEEPKKVMVTADRQGSSIIFTNHGGSDINKVVSIACWINGTDSTRYDQVSLPVATGSSAANNNASAAGPDRVIVIVTFEDGTASVVLNKEL
jgi:flagellin-like protein